jgi:hypothetical protein
MLGRIKYPGHFFTVLYTLRFILIDLTLSRYRCNTNKFFAMKWPAVTKSQVILEEATSLCSNCCLLLCLKYHVSFLMSASVVCSCQFSNYAFFFLFSGMNYWCNSQFEFVMQCYLSTTSLQSSTLLCVSVLFKLWVYDLFELWIYYDSFGLMLIYAI